MKKQVFDVLSDDDVASMVAPDWNASALAHKLLYKALKSSKDNISVVVVVL
jgi:hypothetical protein